MEIVRYPKSKNVTLQAWNAADEYLIQTYQELQEENIKKTAIFHDRFGYLSCHLFKTNPDVVVYLFSQQHSIQQNLKRIGINKLPSFYTPFLDNLEEKWDVALVHMPKSLDMFDMYLRLIHHNSEENVAVLCGFMTRHYTNSFLEIARKYFTEVHQSKALKKARILTLKNKKLSIIQPSILFHPSSDTKLAQYAGVFSKEKVDLATMFLLEHLTVLPHENKILDWGCGNGVIGITLSKSPAVKEIVFMDDNIMAIHSVILNTSFGQTLWHDQIQTLKGQFFDLIVTNPPFHFEYDNDMSISVQFFEDVPQILSPSGRLVIVANKHLNYITHLQKIFEKTIILHENAKYIVYQCRFPLV
ncbi:MAG: methyltransferase [Saprospiraceae bacterium]